MDAVTQINRRQDARHNHYDSENVHRCRKCGSWVSPEKEAPGVMKYDCVNCNETVYESVRTSLRSLNQDKQQTN